MSRNSRKVVFVNGLGESITLQTSPYLISKIDGLGIPSVDRQEQKAPYQDGTTYIDSLLQNRDISIEIDISSGPNNFTEIDTRRRELSQRLCPKYGPGMLTYTTEGGQSYTIAAVPYSVVFPNKDYRGPYARALITFTCNDPYWRKTTSSTISLPTSVNSAESVINPAGTINPSVIELADGNLFVVYINASGYVVSRTYTTSWSAESVINPADSYEPCVIQRSDGSLFLAYVRGSDLALVSRTYVSSWSAESTVSGGASGGHPTVIERSNGSLFAVYVDALNNFLVSRTYTTSWSAESVINADTCYYPSVIERSNGNLVLAYRNVSNVIVSRTYTTSWSAESVINPAVSANPSLIEREDGSLFIAYTRGSDSYLCARTYGIEWSAESVINAANSADPSIVERANDSLFIVYRRSSDGYLVSVTRSVTPVPAVIYGDVPVPFQLTFNGPALNPRIINQDTLEYIRLNITMAAADYFVVDTSFGNKTVKLTSGGIEKNGIAYLDISSVFFQLARGSNTVYFEDDSVASTATASMTWTERYVGV